MADPHLIHNERTKLLANLLNTMANAGFAVGIAAPIAAVFFYSPANQRFAPAAIGIIVWVNIASVLHLTARKVLGGLKP